MDFQPSTRSNRFNSQQSSSGALVGRRKPGKCGFCKRNNEPAHVVESHLTKNPVTGKTTCPLLMKYKCEICGATGEDAHTRSYCPNAVQMRNTINRIQNESKNGNILTTINLFRSNLDGQLNEPGQLSDQSNLASQRTTEVPTLEIRRDRRFGNMSALTSSRFNSAGRPRRRFTRSRTSGQQARN